MIRSRLVAGVAVLSAVAVGAVGGALIGVPGLSGAQPFPQNATSTAATDAAKGAAHPGRNAAGSPLIAAAAKALNLTPQQLLAKLSDGKTTIADVAKQQHVDIKTVIAAMTAADQSRIGNIVNSPWPAARRGGPGGPAGPGGPGPGGPGIGGSFRPSFVPGAQGVLGRLGAMALDPVAKALGITTQQLQADLAKGQTIAQIAKSKNIDVNTIINTLVGDATAKVAQAVKAGYLTQAQADKANAAIKSAITGLVNNGFPKGPPGGFGFHGGGFGRPMPGSKPVTS
jgi:hypothetical protein